MFSYLSECVFNHQLRHIQEAKTLKKYKVTHKFYNEVKLMYKDMKRASNLKQEFELIDTLTEQEKEIILLCGKNGCSIKLLQRIFDMPFSIYIKDIVNGEIW